MKAVVLANACGPDGLTLVDRPDPEPGPGEVLVRLRAASLNFRDTLLLKGGYRSKQKAADLIPLSDGAGEVAAVGVGVDAFKLGDRVTALFYADWLAGASSDAALDSDWGRGRDGMLCEFKVFPAHALVPTPATLSDVEAAALPCAALTAWVAVIRHGQCKPGDIVLTQGTGGVSLFALQFAKLAGAEVIVTSSSDAKLDRVRAMGADHCINYRTTPTWGTEARYVVGGRGIDNVIELGGAETLKQSLIAVRPGGTLSLIGVLSGAKVGDVLLPFIVTREVRLQGITVGSGEDMRAMLRAMEMHAIKPTIDHVFPMADAADAFRHLEAGAHFGKVCIEI